MSTHESLLTQETSAADQLSGRQGDEKVKEVEPETQIVIDSLETKLSGSARTGFIFKVFSIVGF